LFFERKRNEPLPEITVDKESSPDLVAGPTNRKSWIMGKMTFTLEPPSEEISDALH